VPKNASVHTYVYAFAPLIVLNPWTVLKFKHILVPYTVPTVYVIPIFATPGAILLDVSMECHDQQTGVLTKA